MPYIYCDACGAGYYSNVTSCPSYGAQVRRAHTRNRMRRSSLRAAPVRVGEDVENDVREALYGRRPGSVESCSGSRARPAVAQRPLDVTFPAPGL
jgi:hypothetical protein